MKKIIIICILFVSISSCTSDYEELNKDPLAATKVPTTALLTAATQSLINVNSGLGYNKTMMFYSQQWAQRETTTRSVYGLSPDGDWSAFYGILPEIMEIIKLNTGEDKDSYAAYGKNENQIAVATILKVWVFHNLTDTWGNVPYSETFNDDITSPKFDNQEDIYPALLQELKDAVALIDTNASGFTSGDLMYNGDMTKWKTFANSMRARIAMRMSEVNPGLAKTEVADALGASVFTSNNDNAVIAFQNEEANANPLYIEFLTQKWTFIAEPLTDLMNSYGSGTASTPSDPRTSKYADPNDAGEYIGFPYGLETTDTFNYAIGDRSLPNATTRAIDFNSYIMTYSELLFIKAEAEQRGWFGTAGNAATTYKQAITASMEQWGVSSTATTSYLTQTDVLYNASNWKKYIGEQKYLALFSQGGNAWSEWRRLDYPILNFPTAGLLNTTEIPRRYFYPTNEGIINGDNLDQAVIDMGGDTFSTRMWWDQ
ncbi:SusD/RagB family nutrient-binding outer membrane lipoprotein [Polaribacter sp. Q13]|uniref:SusD/RagB family nutrient-binding outer membrane lipoprotein n=1 Tax=Polaribacter sp. Q13 TaxID=2806551 RepID=UPI00193BABE7|nr:SusD/RagB family nutrient-binding outer membrane lipoprotein [Polaribacter sp. Q13]QVY65162.1 SusD/RagB family nutrient-binding outer membrane lipoprotein [Polaribacter sp. Q13]